MDARHIALAIVALLTLAVGCSDEGDSSKPEDGGVSSGGKSGDTSTGGADTGGRSGSNAAGAPADGSNTGGTSGDATASGGTPSAGPSTGGAQDGHGTGGATSGGSGASGTGGSSAASASSGVYRPFAADSPWNTPIADPPMLDPNSDALIADFESSSEWGEHLDVNLDEYSIPLFWADASTPRVTMTARNVGGTGFSGGSDRAGASAEVPMPDGAAPDPESDHHLLIVDRDADVEWGFWDTSDSDGEWACGVGAMLDLSGSGVRPAADEAANWWEAHGARACGFGLIAGLIRPEEIEAGVIEHALVVAYPHIRSRYFTPPASTAQGTNGVGAEPERGIPCGGRIQFDPTINVDSLDVSDAGRTILRALQVYGAYVGDYSGAINLYADNSPAAREYWDSIGFGVYELQDAIDLADFRVLEIGPLHDNNN